MGDPHFRQNLIFVAAFHILLVAALLYFARREIRRPAGDIVWMDPGSFSQIAAADHPQEHGDTPEPAPQITPESTPEPTPPPTPEPTPPPTPESTPPPTPEPAPEEDTIPLHPTPAPQSTPTPKPRVTPTPKPKVTPKPTATPKSTAKPTPKPTPKTSPKPSASPKASPKASASPKATSPAASASPKASGSPSAKASASPDVKSPKATGAASGQTGGGSVGRSGGGGDSSQFGWYHELIHDRFYSQWDQPTSIFDSSKSFVCTLQIRIESDGKISDVKVVRSSGNVVMDDSVMSAAHRVLQIDPLPAGLGGGGAYTVNINFELQ